MLCERCKIRESNIQYTEVNNGIVKEHHLCSQCASEMDFGPYSAIFDVELPLGKLLSGLLGLDETREEDIHVTCPTCGTTYNDFLKDSQFGCQDCYAIFDIIIADDIKKLQGNERHKGKTPINKKGKQVQSIQIPTPSMQSVDILRLQLQEALGIEDYEAAAKYRDLLREIEKGVADE